MKISSSSNAAFGLLVFTLSFATVRCSSEVADSGGQGGSTAQSVAATGGGISNDGGLSNGEGGQQASASSSSATGGESGQQSSASSSSATGGGTCSSCSMTSLCNSDELCPASAPLYDALRTCACDTECAAVCGDTGNDGGACGFSCIVTQECIDCKKTKCAAEWSACLADP